MDTPRLAYDSAVCARLRAARAVPYRRVSPAGWTPKPSECHANVDRWVAEHLGHAAVRGWIICGVGMLTAHSVIRAPDGSLFDITPMPSLDANRSWMLFVVHDGGEASFRARREADVFLYCWPADCEHGRDCRGEGRPPGATPAR